MSFEQFLQFIYAQDGFVIYGILAVSAFVENIFPPFPGDTITLAGAFVAGQGAVGYVGVLGSVTLGGLAGAMTLYFLGRSKGRKFLEKRDNRFARRVNLEKIETWFARFGDFVILASRFMAGVRSAVAVAAGVGNVGKYRMLGLTTISFLLWNSLLIGSMCLAKANWQVIVGFVGRYNLVVVSVFLLVLVGWLARALWVKRS